MKKIWKKVVLALLVLILGGGVAFFVFKTEPRLNKNFESQGAFWKKFPFRLGLDLSGGSHLTYKADLSAVPEGEVVSSMDALRDVIERRVNLFGVSEPVVQVQHSSFISGAGEQLIVDLPGVTDIKKAIEMIGQTPLLEFKIQAPEGTPQTATVDKDGKIKLDINSQFIVTELTGRYLKKVILDFDQNTRAPVIVLQFDDMGAKIFEKITKENIGKPLAIFLDGKSIVDTNGDGVINDSDFYAPMIKQAISGGEATITGDSTAKEAKILVGRLNSGALPVPITLLSTQTIGATLGGSALNAGVKATVIGFLLITLFLILWYRLPGFVSAVSLMIFIVIILALFKLIPVTLTAAGIAGFIISIGIAVDANILIFERVKEELSSGKNVKDAVSVGFSRAWLAIRDSNISNIITALILFWFGTSLIKGFALTLGMGVVVSMFSAITITRIFLSALILLGEGKVVKFLFSSGISK